MRSSTISAKNFLREDPKTETVYDSGLTKAAAVAQKMILCRTAADRLTLYKPKGSNDNTKTADTVRGQHHYVYKVGSQHASGLGGNAVLKLLREATPDTRITICRPMFICQGASGRGCGQASWEWVTDERRSSRCCSRCGAVKPYKSFGLERTLDENGKVDKNAMRLAPQGMVDLYSHDSSSRQKSHYWNKVTIKTLIRDIAGVWQPFIGQDSIVQLAQNKLERVYNIIHPDDEEGDDVRKMWHSPPNVAAAVLWAAVLEMEHQWGRTCCMNPQLIRAHGSQLVKREWGRNTKDVTIKTMVLYLGRLKRLGLCQVHIPQWNSKSLQFDPETATRQHARMAIFRTCAPLISFLPADAPWGLEMEQNEAHGVVTITQVDPGSPAFIEGIRPGDFVLTVNEHEVCTNTTATGVVQRIVEYKQLGKPVKLTIMRKN